MLGLEWFGKLERERDIDREGDRDIWVDNKSKTTQKKKEPCKNYCLDILSSLKGLLGLSAIQGWRSL